MCVCVCVSVCVCVCVRARPSLLLSSCPLTSVEVGQLSVNWPTLAEPAVVWFPLRGINVWVWSLCYICVCVCVYVCELVRACMSYEHVYICVCVSYIMYNPRLGRVKKGWSEEADIQCDIWRLNRADWSRDRHLKLIKCFLLQFWRVEMESFLLWIWEMIRARAVLLRLFESCCLLWRNLRDQHDNQSGNSHTHFSVEFDA